MQVEAINKADKFLEKFLYKKQIKIDLYCILYSIGLSLSIWLYENPLSIRILCLVLLLFNIGMTYIELHSYGAVNESTYIKFKSIYSIALIIFMVFPYDSLAMCALFVIPLCIYFLNLTEMYLGNDSLHWPYIFHLLSGGILFAITFFLKEFVSGLQIWNIDKNTLILLRPFTLAMSVNLIATELVDLRFVFKAKTYRDKIAACYDVLTKLPGRGGLISMIDEKRVTAVAMIDLDHFKEVNDTYGHDKGDLVLIQLANKMATLASNNGKLFVCRWGGEEFVALGEKFEDLYDFCKALQKEVRECPFEIEEHLQITKTISCGIADRDGLENLSNIIVRADDQCYIAKNNGRNQIRYKGEIL